METKQVTPFLSSIFSAVCLFLNLKIIQTHFFMWGDLWSILVCKIPQCPEKVQFDPSKPVFTQVDYDRFSANSSFPVLLNSCNRCFFDLRPWKLVKLDGFWSFHGFEKRIPLTQIGPLRHTVTNTFSLSSNGLVWGYNPDFIFILTQNW